MSRAKRGENNLLAARGLLRRCAPRNDSGCDMASKAHVPLATLATSVAWWSEAWGWWSEAWGICPCRLRSAVCGPRSGIAPPLEPAASAAWRAARNDIPAIEQLCVLCVHYGEFLQWTQEIKKNGRFSTRKTSLV